MLRRILHLTSIVRLLDLRLTSNRAVVLACVVAAAASGTFVLFQGESPTGAARSAGEAGFGIFLAWALARELDPDNPRSALLAIVPAALILVSGTPNLLAVLEILLVARILVRSTGKPPTLIDLTFLVVLAGFGARLAAGVPAGLALGCAVFMDSRLPNPAPRRNMFAGALIIAVTLLGAGYFGAWDGTRTIPTTAQWLVIALVVAALPAVKAPKPSTNDDRDKRRLLGTRLRWATWMSILPGLITLVWTGGPAVPALVGLWAAIISVALSRQRPSRLRTVP